MRLIAPSSLPLCDRPHARIPHVRLRTSERQPRPLNLEADPPLYADHPGPGIAPGDSDRRTASRGDLQESNTHPGRLHEIRTAMLELGPQ
jgi:hypothetical protein